MLAWTTEAEAVGYAESRLEDAIGAMRDLVDRQSRSDAMGLALNALTDAVAALVMVRHRRQGDPLVTLDQLHAESVGLGAAQPPRTCCQTYPAESHAQGCHVGLATAADRWRQL